jgi:hypothetical protein
VDHFPELIGRFRLIIVGHRQLRSEEEVADRVLVEHPVDEDAIGMPFEINPVIAAAEAVKRAAIALDLAEIRPVEGLEIIRQDLELCEKVELEILGKGAHLGGTDGIENDLEHAG